MQGYRTLFVSFAQLIIGLATAFGVVLPEGTEQFIADNGVAVGGGVMALLAVKDWVLRLVTKTPPGVKSN